MGKMQSGCIILFVNLIGRGVVDDLGICRRIMSIKFIINE
jgi:hypothetical protein